jgi:hypothetical protein
MTGREDRTCLVCGRPIAWRRKWQRDWDNVRYCSKSCRSRKGDPTAGRLERIMIDLLRARPSGSSICPSEAARAVASEWRPLMESAREAARRLAAAGRVEITQRGALVDPGRFRGPIRVRLSERERGAHRGT